MRNRAKANTLGHSNIRLHLPRLRDAKDWLRKPLAREIEVDLVMTAICFLLLGWTFFCLLHAIQGGRVTF